MQIYLARNQVQAGPYSLDELNTMLSSGEVVLTDLAWHEGLDNWFELGKLTEGQYYYNPNKPNPSADNRALDDRLHNIFNQPTSQSGNSTESNDNPQSNDKKTNKRITVEELYGRKPTSKTQPNPQADKPSTGHSAEKHPNTGARSTSDKTDNKPAIDINKISKTTVINGREFIKLNDSILASNTQRILASLIDWVTFIMILLPVLLRVDQQKLNEASSQSMSMAETMAISQELAQQIPTHIVLLSNILILAFFVVQLALLVKQGQTIGKLVMGIRILDYKSHQIASATKVVLLRSIFTLFVYLTIPLTIVIDTVYMYINRNRRSLHDKIAGTYVAKASTHNPAHKKPKESKK